MYKPETKDIQLLEAYYRIWREESKKTQIDDDNEEINEPPDNETMMKAACNKIANFTYQAYLKKRRDSQYLKWFTDAFKKLLRHELTPELLLRASKAVKPDAELKMLDKISDTKYDLPDADEIDKSNFALSVEKYLDVALPFIIPPKVQNSDEIKFFEAEEDERLQKAIDDRLRDLPKEIGGYADNGIKPDYSG